MILRLSNPLLYFALIFLLFEVSYGQEYKKMINNSVSYSVEEIIEEAEKHFLDKDKGRGSGYKQFKRWEYNALRMMDETGYLKSNDFYFDELENYNKNRNSRKNVNLNDFWEEIGPTNWNQTGGWNPGVGRLTSIAIDNNNINHIVVGSDVGGVWRTIDEGTNWTPLTDNYNNMDVLSLAIDPQNSDIYYWGSRQGAIYKSLDAGATWSRIGSAGFNTSINRILIHPTNTNIITELDFINQQMEVKIGPWWFLMTTLRI